MDAAAEQLVLDYLRRLEDAARGRLGAAERMAFMARSRVAVARQISETRATEPAEVQRLLRRFGDPGGLAARERQRLDRETPAGPGGAVTALRPDGAGAASGLDGAAMARDLNGAATARDPDGARSAPSVNGAGGVRGQNGAAAASSLSDAGAARDQDAAGAVAGPNGAGPASGGVQRHVAPAPQAARLPGRLAAAAAGRPSATAPALHRPMTARWRPGRDVPARLAPGPAPDRTAGPGPGTGGDGEPGAERGTGGAGWLGGVLAVVRRHPLECLAVVLIGLGGLIDPWPLWLIGALAVLASPLWDMRDKLAAVAIPLAAALVGAVAAAGFAARPPGLSGYAHEVRVDGWNLLRAGAVLGAIYLARRIRRGRRPRREPPWRRPPADAR